MDSYDLADVKARLSELVRKVEGGASFEITRCGKAVARVVPVTKPPRPVDWRALDALRGALPPQADGAGTFVRGMRDVDRY